MNNKGQKSLLFGMAFIMVFLLIILTTFAFIEPLKESLDTNRGTVSLNCPSTPNHNATAYEEDSPFNRLVRRPTCFVTGVSMVWLVSAVLISGFSWVAMNWRKLGS